MKKMITGITALTVLSILLMGFACGGGGGGGDSSSLDLASLEGTWSGPMTHPSGEHQKFGVALDAMGAINTYSINGSDFPETGTVTHNYLNHFSFAFSEFYTIPAEFVVSDDASYGVMMYHAMVSVMQRGTSPLPAYAASDFAGTWSGDMFSPNDIDGIYEKAAAATLAIDETFNLAGTLDSDAIVGAVAGSNLTFGSLRLAATYLAGDWYMLLLMSPDRQTLGGMMLPFGAETDEYDQIFILRRSSPE